MVFAAKCVKCLIVIVKINSLLQSKIFKSKSNKRLTAVLAPKTMDSLKDFQGPTCNVFKEILVCNYAIIH